MQYYRHAVSLSTHFSDILIQLFGSNTCDFFFKSRTPAPTSAPTNDPTSVPTRSPTDSPTNQPTNAPIASTPSPTSQPVTGSPTAKCIDPNTQCDQSAACIESTSDCCTECCSGSFYSQKGRRFCN